MFKIRKVFKFEMAHRLVTSFSEKCRGVHGHSYVMEVVLESEMLNADGMVLDFGQLKQLVTPIVENFDHHVVLWSKDPLSQILGEAITVPYNPTAENMARDVVEFLASQGLQELNPGIERITVRMHETSTGWAEYSATISEMVERLVGENDNGSND